MPLGPADMLGWVVTSAGGRGSTLSTTVASMIGISSCGSGALGEAGGARALTAGENWGAPVEDRFHHLARGRRRGLRHRLWRIEVKPGVVERVGNRFRNRRNLRSGRRRGRGLRQIH